MRSWLDLVLAIAGIALVSWSLTYGLGEGGLAGLTQNWLLIAIAAAPYLVLAGAGRLFRTRTAHLVSAAGLAGLSIFWVWAFGGVVWWNPRPDAQDGFTIFLLPPMIAGLGTVVLVAAGLCEWLTRARGRAPA